MAINKGNIVCVFGVKGGIGKSILTLNLAGVLSNMNKRVLIVDMDLYGGSISIILNKKVNKSIYNFVDDFNNNRYDNFNDYITKYNDNIDYLACPKDPRKASKIDSSYIEILLDKAKFNYDLILIDTNHILNEMNLTLLDKCDNILLVTTNDMLDMKNMRSLISIFKDLDIDRYKVILNNSFRNDKTYFNLYDIKSVINNNIDYEISNKLYIKNIDKYIMDGNIVTIDKKYSNSNYGKVFNTIVNDILGDNNE